MVPSGACYAEPATLCRGGDGARLLCNEAAGVPRCCERCQHRVLPGGGRGTQDREVRRSLGPAAGRAVRPTLCTLGWHLDATCHSAQQFGVMRPQRTLVRLQRSPSMSASEGSKGDAKHDHKE